MSNPVKIRGVLYPSMAAAARELGVGESTIYSALERGTLDNVGLGPGQAVTFDGITYPSRTAAAKALGVHRFTVARWIKEGRGPKKESRPKVKVPKLKVPRL